MEKGIRILPSNSSKFLSNKIDSVLFLDSCQFLLASLDSLVKNIADDDNNFRLLNEAFGSRSKYLKRKLVYCYDYFSSFDTYKEKELPCKQRFFNSLTNKHITDEEYNSAKTIFREFGCQSLEDFTKIYVRCDVYLLACVFQEFRDMSLQFYKLDPVYFYSLPGLAWSAAMRWTKVELELLTDESKYLFLEAGIRGGDLYLNDMLWQTTFTCQKQIKKNILLRMTSRHIYFIVTKQICMVL